jgi:hypothetical protein
MNEPAQTTRLPGLLWFLTTAIGGFGFGYIRSSIVAGDAQATATNILAAESLFRLAIVCSLVSQIFLFFFGLTIFHLFKELFGFLATVLLTSVLLTVGVAVANHLNHLGALVVLGQPEYLKVFTADQLKAMAMLLLRLAVGTGQGLLEMFWVSYYFALGLLVIRSKAAPRILGALQVLMSFGFAINILQKFLVPQFHPQLFTTLAMSCGALGGIPSILWFLIVGLKIRRPTEATTHTPRT